MEINIYTLAHEIKNPLAVAHGYVEMSNEKNFFKYKELINSNIEEALQILDSYLEFNKLNIEKEVIDIILLLEEIRNNYKDLFKIKIDIISIYEELFIEGDYFKLKQVFNNLVKNSIEAGSKNITIYTKIINDFLIIRVVDDGTGFNNIDNLEGYSSKINGHGIGLLITKKIIKSHSGTIEYANNDVCGCNVVVKLPIKL